VSLPDGGWNFELAGLNARGAQIESISARPCFQPEAHQLFVGGDWEAAPRFTINFGVGFDLGDRGSSVVLKSRFEWH